MYSARCTQDGNTYTAVDFSRLLREEIEIKRKFLQCSECAAPAFFRKRSRTGGAACFGAKPHAAGCEYASAQYLSTDSERITEIIEQGNRIKIDFNFGTPNQENTNSQAEPSSSSSVERRRGNFGIGGAGQNRTQRRLSTLLRTLIDDPSFRSSSNIIEVENQPDIEVRNFFVPLREVDISHVGQYRGCWGMLTDARITRDGTLWLNSGGPDSISFPLSQEKKSALFDRYGIVDVEELAGVYILAIGNISLSPNGKYYCALASIEYLTLRFD